MHIKQDTCPNMQIMLMHMQQAKAQIRLHICAVWSERFLFAYIMYESWVIKSQKEDYRQTTQTGFKVFANDSQAHFCVMRLILVHSVIILNIGTGTPCCFWQIRQISFKIFMEVYPIIIFFFLFWVMWIANSVDPDQTSTSSLIWLICLPRCFFQTS